ncbi:saccharopine dehydrogenase C-terminal domain-containing protein [Danxiaibacter flavus]|uniref:Saccharopine dehydrogenase C-terminal domain-containing protein n=1 Tax=Danxiaibacter flavus TaxID=3049108 RepID=A0ABV3ZAJ0_9BACT|nr:saccharopine dehydrogenase C-terminal domain-containing protein [Chitinophagaceae bacterium DXS]
MKQILLFGAGKSSSVLIEYLKKITSENQWTAIVADNNLYAAQEKTGNHPLVTPIEINIHDDVARKNLVQKADVVISLMPPALHYLVAKECVAEKKHLITASYIDDNIRQLEKDIVKNDLLFLCEMGLDPGIDHMSAMQLIHRIKNNGARITSFKSHCGGLVAPESDDNPWHYKISWNPRNVILAGKAGAEYREDNKAVHLGYETLFDSERLVHVPGLQDFAYYPNRDSLSYIPLYHLDEANTFVRTTLRHPDFCLGWKNIVDLQLTNEEKIYDTNGMTIAAFFKNHFEKHGFGEWLKNMLSSRIDFARDLMEKLMMLVQQDEQLPDVADVANDMMLVDQHGQLNTVTTDNVKTMAAEKIARQMHEANVSMNQLFFIGLEDQSLINKDTCSAADIMQMILEKKLALQSDDKDLVVMMHEIEYEKDRKKSVIKSVLAVKGDNNRFTAMAKTVGLPLGIAANLILKNKIPARGLHIPVIESIYDPVLSELRLNGIAFEEYES